MAGDVVTLNVCPECRTRKSAVSIARRDMRDCARRLARSKSDNTIRLRDELAVLKDTVRVTQENLERHEAECMFVPESAPPIRGVRKAKATKPHAGSKVAANRAARVPDRSVLLAAIAAQPPILSLPSAPEVSDSPGCCESCGKTLPPGRRLCGRCYATGGRP